MSTWLFNWSKFHFTHTIFNCHFIIHYSLLYTILFYSLFLVIILYIETSFILFFSRYIKSLAKNTAKQTNRFIDKSVLKTLKNQLLITSKYIYYFHFNFFCIDRIDMKCIIRYCVKWINRKMHFNLFIMWI